MSHRHVSALSRVASRTPSCSTGLFGGWSKALAAYQFNDVFGMLALTKPVLGARPTRFGSGRPEDLVQTAHG
ncbi:MAG: hypothetical protein E6J82_04460 [Deltaproteobacteria bacterium]|nr:MAG: hypothetical protein E6J82_04460 [Deltaproteobacteria bacterium]